MTVYSVDLSKLRVEKQADTWLCWAATVKAVGDYYGVTMPDQLGMAVPYGNAAKDPEEILGLKGFTTSALFDYQTKPTEGEVLARCQAIRENLQAYLPSGPMLLGLVPADDTRWTKANGDTYLWKHATLLYCFNDATDLIQFRDPAKPEEDNSRGVTVRELVSGFDYMALGPVARAQLQNPPDFIRARVRYLRYFMAPH